MSSLLILLVKNCNVFAWFVNINKLPAVQKMKWLENCVFNYFTMILTFFFTPNPPLISEIYGWFLAS